MLIAIVTGLNIWVVQKYIIHGARSSCNITMRQQQLLTTLIKLIALLICHSRNDHRTEIKSSILTAVNTFLQSQLAKIVIKGQRFFVQVMTTITRSRKVRPQFEFVQKVSAHNHEVWKRHKCQNQLVTLQFDTIRHKLSYNSQHLCTVFPYSTNYSAPNSAFQISQGIAFEMYAQCKCMGKLP